MKYMTFNSSCSYAGLANMLARCEVDTDDRSIALEMGLPYFFAKEGNTFLSGPALQTAEWFDLFLNPRGFALRETMVEKSDVPSCLIRQNCAMLGLHQDGGGKHAFIYIGTSDDRFHFLNNKWAHDPSPEIITLTEHELSERLDNPCIIAKLDRIAPLAAPIRQKMTDSLAVLEDYRRELLTVCGQTFPITALRQKLNPTFRALFLDGITMLELLGQDTLHRKAVAAQQILLTALRGNADKLRLTDHLSATLINELIDDRISLIQAFLQ